MNPLVKKEIRLLLPAWIAAMALAMAPAFVLFADARTIQYIGGELLFSAFTRVFFPLGILILGISPFGQEFSFRTFPTSLSQPVPRRQIWRVKTAVLSLAFATVLLASILAQLIFHRKFPGSPLDLVGESEFTILVVLASFSGGLWTTLLLRQVTAAFWFTLLVPGAIAVSIGGLAGHFDWSEKTWDCAEIALLLLYSIAGFLYARRLFFRAQDTQWTGGNIIFPWRKRFSARTGVIVPGGLRNRFVALVWKEIQLHEVNLFLTAALLGLNLVAILIHNHTTNAPLKEAMEMIPLLWLLMPLLIGAAAVAEERKLGTLEAQLCLPVSRKAQFSIKFFMGLILTMVLGAALPSLLEWTSHPAMTWWRIFVIATGIYFVSFYASTLTRSTLQAIGFTLGIPVAVWAVVLVVALLILPHFFPDYERTDAGWTILALGVWGWLLLPLVLARLMFWNFRWLHRDWKMWRRNAAVVAVFFTLVVALTNAVYFRTWELFQAKDYPHGPARLSEAKSVKVFIWGGAISAILPDGRLWNETLAYNYHQGDFIYWRTLATDRIKTQFAPGTNWTDVAANGHETLAVKSNGTLWCALNRWEPPGNWTQTAFTRIGPETNWLRAAAAWRSWDGFLLLKTDGSLWVWGTNHSANVYQMQMLDLKTPPARISDDTNWMELFTTDFTCAKKSDGSLWSWQQTWNGNKQVWRMVQKTNWDVDWFVFNQRGVAVGTNGELWVATSQWDNTGYNIKPKLQLGRGMKWKAATFINYGNALIALRDDGTLWKSSALSAIEIEPEKIRLSQLGNHSDWIALPPNYSDGIALAADGSLWSWGQMDTFFFLAPSRKPVYLGNVFGKAESATSGKAGGLR